MGNIREKEISLSRSSCRDSGLLEQQKSYKQVCGGKEMKKITLDDEEKDILESYERGEWVPVKNAKKEIKKLRQYAKNTLQKDKRINILEK